MQRKKLLFSFTALFSFAMPFLCLANMTVTKVTDRYGFLMAVFIRSQAVTFRVSVYGYLESVTPTNPKRAALNRLNRIIGKKQVPPQMQVLHIKHYPASALSGNGGKIAEANGIRVAYYPCSSTNRTLSSLQYHGEKVYPNDTASPLTISPRYRDACPSVSGNGGKVRQIGDIIFSYYSPSHFSCNGGKLRRIGNIIITYYSQNSFQGNGGQLKSFGDQ